MFHWLFKFFIFFSFFPLPPLSFLLYIKLIEGFIIGCGFRAEYGIQGIYIWWSQTTARSLIRVIRGNSSENSSFNVRLKSSLCPLNIRAVIVKVIYAESSSAAAFGVWVLQILYEIPSGRYVPISLRGINIQNIEKNGEKNLHARGIRGWAGSETPFDIRSGKEGRRQTLD